MPARRTVLIDAFPDSAFRHRERTVACIDVMLATTTLVTAAGQGRRTLVASSPEELAALTRGLDGALVAGRLSGVAPGVFTLEDGPEALLRQQDGDRPLVLASPPGTELVANAAAGSGRVFLCCFRNLSATASALATQSRVALLAAGCREEFSCEDQMAAAWIAGRLVEGGFEIEDRRTADIVRRWSGIQPALAGWGNSAAELRREGRAGEVEFVLNHVDDVDRACVCEGSEVRLAPAEAVAERGGTAAMKATEYDEYEERPGRDVLEYLEIPFRYPRYVWIPFATILALALLLAMAAPRKFRSGTLILVESKNMPEYFVTPVTTEGMTQQLNTIRQVVMSRTRLERVIETLDPYPEMAGQPSHVVVEAMRRAIEIRVQGNDSFVIEYVNRDPHKAMMVTNMLATQFTEDAGRLRDALTRKAYDFIQENVNDARRALEEREAALREHKQKYWGSLPEQLDSNLRVLQQLQLEQQTLGDNLRTLGERRAALERSLLEGRRLATSAGDSPAPAAELAKLRAAYDSFRGRYTPDHPDMRALAARIERLEHALAEEAAKPTAPRDPLSDPETASLSESLRLVEADIAALESRRDRLDEKISGYQARVEETPRAEQQLASLTRDYQQLRENYNAALKKEMDAEMARRLEEYWKGGYFRVLDPAYLPRRPIRAYAPLFLLGGLVLGLGAGLVAAFVADLLDRSVKTERDLGDLVACPVLVTVPRAAPFSRGARA